MKRQILSYRIPPGHKHTAIATTGGDSNPKSKKTLRRRYINVYASIVSFGYTCSHTGMYPWTCRLVEHDEKICEKGR